MYLELDEQQRALAGLARDLLDDVRPLERVRAGDPGPDGGVWRRLAQSGLTGLGVPEADGGSGGSEVDVAVLLEEAGRAALVEPLREAMGVVAPLLATHGTDEQRDRWLAPLAAGECMLGLVPGAEARLAGHRALDAALIVSDDRCLVVPIERLHLRPVTAADPGRGLAKVVDVEAGEADVLPGARPDEVAVRGAAATAAALVGLAQRLLDVARDHARVREQFGRPIGSFQAVQHPLVDVHVAVETARVAAWYAALRLAEASDDAPRAASVAKAAADEASARADRVALQVLGGIGFTWEHDLHLLSKRATAWRSEFGQAHEHHRRLGAALVSGEVGDRGGSVPTA